VLSSFAAEPPAFSPNGDGRLDAMRFTFTLAEPAAVRLRIRRGSAWVATPVDGSLETGPQSVAWDGRKRRGRALDGTYDAELTVTTVVSSVTQRLPFRLDTAAPTLRLVRLWPLRLRVSEAATIVVTVAGRRREIRAARPGIVRVPLRVRPTRLRATARDDAGNLSRPLRSG
jgi:hypothetical protein